MIKKANTEVEKNPKVLTIFGQSKVGKTTACSLLPNSLIIDLENGSGYISSGYKVNVLQESVNQQKPPYAILKELSKEIQESKQKFDFLVFDTLTGLEAIAESLALFLYKKSPLGKNYTGNDVLDLPMGAGYMWLRKAFDMLLNKFNGLSKYTILLGHLKISSLVKDGKEFAIQDINLTGKLKQMVLAQSDAIGLLTRKKNQTVISFKTNTEEVLAGARPEHLRGQEFVLVEQKNGKFISNWDKIFIK